MISNNSIRVTDLGSVAELHCPRCGAANLHHETVITYERGEDQPTTSITQVRARETIVSVQASDGCGNPSSRRHGLTIDFTCEQCSKGQEDVLQLRIAQHKGATEISWRYEPK